MIRALPPAHPCPLAFVGFAGTCFVCVTKILCLDLCLFLFFVLFFFCRGGGFRFFVPHRRDRGRRGGTVRAGPLPRLRRSRREGDQRDPATPGGRVLV